MLMISFSVNNVLHTPAAAYWTATKRMLRYVQVTMKVGLTFQKSSSIFLSVFLDADWADCIEDIEIKKNKLHYLDQTLKLNTKPWLML
jgi:hypothetical protein